MCDLPGLCDVSGLCDLPGFCDLRAKPEAGSPASVRCVALTLRGARGGGPGRKPAPAPLFDPWGPAQNVAPASCTCTPFGGTGARSPASYFHTPYGQYDMSRHSAGVPSLNLRSKTVCTTDAQPHA
eukprot:31508-Chlamydomonas_euryale.AAC.2